MKGLLDAFQFMHVVQMLIGLGMHWKISFGFAGIVAHLTPVVQNSKLLNYIFLDFFTLNFF